MKRERDTTMKANLADSQKTAILKAARGRLQKGCANALITDGIFALPLSVPPAAWNFIHRVIDAGIPLFEKRDLYASKLYIALGDN